MSASMVTTIIPVFNRAEMLLEAVGSVLAQTYRPIEIVIVDDGSTDETPSIAQKLAAEHPEVVRVIHQENRGVGLAREAGRLAARGEFIQHLDSDDLLLPRKFELQVCALEAAPDCGASYGFTRWRYADGRVEPSPAKQTGQTIETMLPAMLESRFWDTPSPLYRASLIREAGPWLDLRAEEDWEFDARIASRGVRLHHCKEWVCEVRRHEGKHLSGRSDVATLRDRAIAHRAIFQHAIQAHIGPEAPEMQHFARELFFLSRQCGAAGLAEQSRMLFGLSREASGEGANRAQFRLYELLARTIGYSAAGKLSALADRFRW